MVTRLGLFPGFGPAVAALPGPWARPSALQQVDYVERGVFDVALCVALDCVAVHELYNFE